MRVHSSRTPGAPSATRTTRPPAPGRVGSHVAMSEEHVVNDPGTAQPPVGSRHDRPFDDPGPAVPEDHPTYRPQATLWGSLNRTAAPGVLRSAASRVTEWTRDLVTGAALLHRDPVPG